MFLDCDMLASLYQPGLGGIVERSKTCFKCGETKLLRYFYRHPQMADGHLNKCKECTKADNRRQVRSKTCFKCGETKPLRSFYRHPEMADGHLNKCKECTKADTRAREAKDPLSVLHSRLSAWRKRPTQANTYRVLEAAKAADTLKVPSACQMCGRTDSYSVNDMDLHGHHFDYDSPLSVVFLCAKCHSQLHILIRERKSAMAREE